ncbi:Aldo/keto reductase [Neocallimastix lanati (nom. inval.)]|jgi:diketogulonate reductase-like aldo/keto reductase|uniref:Aldo/keto reductase n=1 Tax=Neocallimastix californiae TaxID=1754190 RepID=A0A1Y2ANF9_9FUNG|nr:Aldo/keto reductase [Neocallimastix sp. JGI-2020a]ORY24099.1 Aldo/keto reductase [Neocallimastix californiae]|eukprot:ORY24099.1 Aldo/keto reductase [Neocallimastix californiae]
MIFDQTIKLNNGVEIPTLGLGTWLIEDSKAADAVANAIKIGYRHIDTAEAYDNEKGVGEGIRKSGVPRDQIFLTTKLAAEIKNYEEAKKAIQQSLDDLNVDYVDLMIIHSPQPWNSFRDGKHYEDGNVAAWKALEEFYKAGKIRAIGVSNFEKVDIENILAHCTVKPAVNQVLVHVSNTPFELIEYCKSQGIVIEAYSPMGHGEILKNPVLNEMAKAYNVSVPQLCIRYTIQLGFVTLPKTANPEHMKSNADVDFVISDKDMEILKNIERIKDYGDAMKYPGFQKLAEKHD